MSVTCEERERVHMDGWIEERDRAFGWLHACDGKRMGPANGMMIAADTTRSTRAPDSLHYPISISLFLLLFSGY
jgi:hypothetical protein